MLLKDFISRSVKDLEPLYCAEEARSVVLMLCGEILGTKSYTHIIEPGFTVNDYKLSLLEERMKRLSEGEPIQYVLGYADFCGRRFRVDSSVLIPRPETEQLCHLATDAAMRRNRMRSAFGGADVKILDLCTGSGCIAWTMSFSVPRSEVLAVDVSPEALEIASGQNFRSELKKENVKAPVFIEGDILEYAENPDERLSAISDRWGQFDILISNPPYVMESEKKRMRKNVCGYEPSLALFVPDDNPLVFYKAIAVCAEKLLAVGGAGFVEINEALGDATADVFVRKGFSEVGIIKDFCSKNRFVKFIK